MAGRTGSADCRSRFKARSYARAEFASVKRAHRGCTLLPKWPVARRSLTRFRHPAWHRKNERPAWPRKVETHTGGLGAKLINCKPMIDDETLDRQLREAAAYINDDGFTA